MPQRAGLPKNSFLQQQPLGSVEDKYRQHCDIPAMRQTPYCALKCTGKQCWPHPTASACVSLPLFRCHFLRSVKFQKPLLCKLTPEPHCATCDHIWSDKDLHCMGYLHTASLLPEMFSSSLSEFSPKSAAVVNHFINGKSSQQLNLIFENCQKLF